MVSVLLIIVVGLYQIQISRPYEQQLLKCPAIFIHVPFQCLLYKILMGKQCFDQRFAYVYANLDFLCLLFFSKQR